MTLTSGTRLGPYEVVGAGGMGEVFRARDTKLNRDVAIKVLPAEFASDTERVARFKREAQVLASLKARFRRDGKELSCIADHGQMMPTTIRLGATFSFDAPKPLFKTPILPRSSETATEHDVTRDGQRFLIGTVLDTFNSAAPRPIIVTNWTAELAANREERK